jgi:hypothetical protein
VGIRAYKNSSSHKYPPAARRLEAALEHVTGTMTCKSDQLAFGHTRDFTVQFFKSGSKKRLDITSRWASNENPINPRKGSRTYLFTPTQAVVVDDPGTLRARVARTGGTPMPGDLGLACVECWRFVEGAYCYDGNSIADKIKDGAWALTSVSRDARKPEWITVTFSISDRVSLGRIAQKQIGSARITFSPGEDWAIRQYHVQSDQPQSLQFELVNESFTKLPHGCVPEACHVETFWRGKLTEPWTRGEKIQYKLEGITTDPIADSTFMLSDLGIAEPKTK